MIDRGPAIGTLAPKRARPTSRAICGFAIAWISFFAILFWPALPDGLSAEGKAAMATTIWAAIIWLSEAIPTAVSGVLIPLLLVLGGAVPTFASAVSGFAAPVVFLCLTAFIFAAIVQIAGLDHRVALYLLDRFKVRTANGVIWALFGVNLLLSFIVPAANARSAALLPVTNGITALFGDTPAEQDAKKAIVIQTLVYGSMISGMCILTAHLPNVVITALIEKQLGWRISYLDWLRLQWPYLGMFVLTQLWVQFYFKSRSVQVPGGHEAIVQERSALPRMRPRDYGILAVFSLVAVLWATQQFHGFTTEIVALIGLAILFAPGLLDIPWQQIQQRTIWGTLFLLAGALSLSAAIGSSGLAAWLADRLYFVAAGRAWWSVLLLFMVGTHIVRLGMLSNVASVTLMAPILLALAPKLGLHSVAFTLLVSDTDSFAYLLPTQITAGVIAYSSGAFSMADYAKVGIVSVAIAILYGVFIMVPWYAAIGLPLWNPAAPWPLGNIHG